MIDVKNTILSTIKNAIGRLMYLGDNNLIKFKKIISLIILDDMLDWAKDLHHPLEIQKKLMDLRVEYIIKNCEFITESNSLCTDWYTNVNTPLTIFTWQRVWDQPNVDIATATPEEETPTTTSNKTTTNCTLLLIHYGEGYAIPAKPDGTPDLNINTLTECEKMNIYINNNGEMCTLNLNTGEWEPVVTKANSIEWTNVLNKPTIYSGIKHEVNDTNHTVDVQLTTENHPLDDGIDVLTAEDIEDIL